MKCTKSTSGVSLKWVREGSLTSSTTSQNLDETTPEVAMYDRPINTAYAFKTDSQVIAYPDSRRVISDEQYMKDLDSSNAGSTASVDNTRGSHHLTKVVKEHREREAKMMQDLNQRLATHIEKVRFFECQNRRLADEMEMMKRKWTERTRSSASMADAQMLDLKRRLDESERERAKLDMDVLSLSRQLEATKQRAHEISELYETDKKKHAQKEARLYELDAGTKLLHSQLEETDKEKNRLRADNASLHAANMRLKSDLDAETLKRKEAERKLNLSSEQLEKLKRVHEEELGAMQGLAFKDSTADNRAMWQSEMAQALQDIQKTYEEKMAAVHAKYDERVATMQVELEARYKEEVDNYQRANDIQNKDVGQLKRDLKKYKLTETQLEVKLNERETELAHLRNQLETQTREFEKRANECDSENKCLRSKVKRLNAELDATLGELEGLLHSNPYLEMEISAYRTLLDRGEQESAPTCERNTSNVGAKSSGGSTYSSKSQKRR